MARWDTKGPDYAFLAERLRAAGVGVIVVDAGTGTATGISPDIPAEMGTPHSTINNTWRALRLIVTYTPGGEEQALTAQPGFAWHPSGDIVGWTRSGA